MLTCHCSKSQLKYVEMDTKELLTRGVEQVLPSKEGLSMLMSKKKITLFQGFDPTAPSLHIGHFIGLRKLAQFQKLGHNIIFLIGDFTGLIGDPTDKSAARKTQSREEVLKNLKDYKKQAGKLIDFEGDNKATVVFNSDWLSKLNFNDVVNLASNFTVQQMIERDMFQDRIREKRPIYLHEFLYPLMQGYDSVAMTPDGVDLEIGGSDQLFNMLAGRTLMKTLKNKEKFVLSMKLLTDANGKKMGKSEGNAVFLTDSPKEIFGKIMSWPDSFIDAGVELLTDLPLDFSKGKNPLEAKKAVAYEVVKQVYDQKEALDAQENFVKTFTDKAPEFNIRVSSGETLAKTTAAYSSNASISSAKTTIKQGGVDVNEKPETDANYIVKPGDRIKFGKRTYLIAK